MRFLALLLLLTAAPLAAPAKAIAEVAPKSRGEVYILDRPGAEQTLIISAQLAPPKRYANEFPFQSFNDAFGGAFISRLNMNLREDKHWSYGAGAFPFDARGQRLWITYATGQTDKTKESLQEVVKELADVTGARPISAAGGRLRQGGPPTTGNGVGRRRRSREDRGGGAIAESRGSSFHRRRWAPEGSDALRQCSRRPH